jgi:hypothetical protein
MFCASCACELPAIAKFCVRCGSRVEHSVAPVQQPHPVIWQENALKGSTPAKCLKCGYDNASEYSFCTACGEQLSQSASNTSRVTVGTSFSPIPASVPQSSTSHVSDLGECSPLSKAGDILVVPPHSVLPPHCVRCGNTATEPWVKITFSWHHPGYYFFLVSPILYAIVALIVRRKIKILVPLCKPHKSIRKKRLWMGAILLLGCIPLPVLFAAFVDNEAANEIALFLGLGMFIAGLLFLVFAPPLRPVYIGPSGAHLKGAAREFLAYVSDAR